MNYQNVSGYVMAQENTGQEEDDNNDGDGMEEDDYDYGSNSSASSGYSYDPGQITGNYDGDTRVTQDGDMQVWNSEFGAWSYVQDAIEVVGTGNNTNWNMNTIDFSSYNGDPGSVLAGTFVISGSLLADDITVAGVIDDVAIPVVLATGLIIASYMWWQTYYGTTSTQSGTEICYILYVQCKERNGNNIACDDCLTACIRTGGDWPFEKCSIPGI